MKVLLVEDSANDRAIYAHLLKDSGVELSFAHTLTSALEALAKSPYDCVLIDPGLPDSIPSETVKIIMERNPDATAIVVSGDTSPETRAAAVKAGVHAYLLKGISDTSSEDLLRVIKDAITRCKIKAGCG